MSQDLALESSLQLNKLLYPETVAIFGASSDKNKIGNLQLKALLNAGYEGEIYPINPKSSTIEDLTAYPSIDQVPKQVDLAILCVNANLVETCLAECGKHHVQTAVIFASGYGETGAEGEAAEARLRDIAKKYNIRVIGPNCVGILNTTNGLMGTFSPGLTNIPINDKQEVGFVTQSGAFGVLTYIAAAQHGLTFNYFVSVGNEVDVQFSDVVEYMLHDDKTKVISGYLEGEKNPEKLRELAYGALEKNKPVVIMKSGRSNAGSRAASSHTGSLAGQDKIYDSFFKQTGVVRAEDFDDIITFSKLFLTDRLPKGRNTAIITSSGGRGINEADRCEAHGLHIHELDPKTKAAIEENIPSYASAANPIDLTAAASITNTELFLEPLKVLIHDDNTDIIVFSEFPSWDETNPLLHEFVELCQSTDKLVFVMPFPLQHFGRPEGADYLEEHGIPVILGDLNPVRALSKLVDYSEAYHAYQAREKHDNKHIGQKDNVTKLLSSHDKLSESQSKEILKSFGVPIAETLVAKSSDQAAEFASQMGYPVVLKIDSEDIPHKTEANAIKLNLSNEAAVKAAYDEIIKNAKAYDASANINGVTVNEMIDLSQGTELIVGVTNDAVFGPTIMLGIGGVFVEVFEDVSFRIAPITRADAYKMIDELKGKKILDGVRNQAGIDKEAVVDTLLKVSALIETYGDKIAEVDINPLIASDKGVVAVDGLVILK